MSRLVGPLLASVLMSLAQASGSDAAPKCTVRLASRAGQEMRDLPIGPGVHLIRVFDSSADSSTYERVKSEVGSGSDLWVKLVPGDTLTADCGARRFRVRNEDELHHEYLEQGVVISYGTSLDSHELDLDNPDRSQSLLRKRNFPITSRYQSSCRAVLIATGYGEASGLEWLASQPIAFDLNRTKTLSFENCPKLRWWEPSRSRIACLNQGSQAIACEDPSVTTLAVSLCAWNVRASIVCAERGVDFTASKNPLPGIWSSRWLLDAGPLGEDILAGPRIDLREFFSNSGGSIPLETSSGVSPGFP